MSDPNVTTAAQVSALLNQVESRLPPQQRPRFIGNLARRMDHHSANMTELMNVVRLIRDAVARLPAEAQARAHVESLRELRTPFPRMLQVLGTPGSPGSVLNLPPALQVEPLRVMVDFVLNPPSSTLRFPPRTGARAAIENAVNALPDGIGTELKNRLAGA